MKMLERLKNVDYLNIAMYASFVIAITLYFISGKASNSFRVCFLLAVIFLFIGIALTVVRLYITYSVPHTIYKTSLMEKRLSLFEEYGSDSPEIEKELKEYKKTALKDYRQTSKKYMFFMCILAFFDLYILYYGLSVLLNW